MRGKYYELRVEYNLVNEVKGYDENNRLDRLVFCDIGWYNSVMYFKDEVCYFVLVKISKILIFAFLIYFVFNRVRKDVW